MKCIQPWKVGFLNDGKTLCWSPKKADKQYASFKLPCGECLPCRLDYAREWAIRCVHEAQMHTKNCFITLTYSEPNLKSPILQYSDWQNFMKRLRKTQNDPIGAFVTGEYGEKNKRPHWHAILFNYSPSDQRYHRKNERGDTIYTSRTLDKIWGFNDPDLRPNEIGSVTFDSAGYCARYAAKKLVHGADADHAFHPISKKSSKHAIGKKWLEKYWPDVFNAGKIILPGGKETSIPRYYERWFKDKHFEKWLEYDLKVKKQRIEAAQKMTDTRQKEYMDNVHERALLHKKNPLTPNEIEKKIIEAKFKLLQANLKL